MSDENVPVPDGGDGFDAARLRRVAAAAGLPAASRHLFLCCDQTKPKCCDHARGLEAWEYLKKRLKQLGLSESGGVARTKANCASAKAGPSPWSIPRARGPGAAPRRCWSASSRSTWWAGAWWRTT